MSLDVDFHHCEMVGVEARTALAGQIPGIAASNL